MGLCVCACVCPLGAFGLGHTAGPWHAPLRSPGTALVSEIWVLAGTAFSYCLSMNEKQVWPEAGEKAENDDL